MSSPAVLDRVRKLLALATSSNVHEAAAAAARAQRLIAQHRLEAWLAVEVDPDPIEDASDEPLEVARRIRKWKVVLASALAEANGCVAYTAHRVGPLEEAIVLVGRRRDRIAVRELWNGLVKRIEWLSATHGPNKPRAWHEAFRIGAVDAVVERLRSVNAEVRAEQEEGLVRLDTAAEAHRAALERFVSERMRLGKGRSIRVDGRAWEKGKVAGERMEITDPREPHRTSGARRGPRRHIYVRSVQGGPMRVGAVCTRAVVTIRGDEVVERAVERLRRFHVGDLVVIDAGVAKPKPIGVLTDRDIAVSVVATAPDHLVSLRCDEVVRRPVVFVAENDDLFEAIDAMVDGHLRRLPVVDEEGWLVGILTMDDVLGLLARTLSRLTSLPQAQRADEWETRRS